MDIKPQHLLGAAVGIGLFLAIRAIVRAYPMPAAKTTPNIASGGVYEQ
jgi:hypothetical protein